MVLCVSLDDGRIYDPAQLDDPNDKSRWFQIVVPAGVRLTPAELCSHESMVEVLLQSGQAKLLK